MRPKTNAQKVLILRLKIAELEHLYRKAKADPSLDSSIRDALMTVMVYRIDTTKAEIEQLHL